MTNAPRRFTPEGANATLPLVSRIVADLLRLHPAWRAAVTSYELAQADADASGESPSSLAARLEVATLAAEIEACLGELDQVGCQFRDFELGLVDFPARLEGRDVHLCWHHGEPAVEHWHEVDAGFAGRRPLPVALSSQETR